MVDSNDRERIEEAADELQKMVSVDIFLKENSFFFFFELLGCSFVRMNQIPEHV